MSRRKGGCAGCCGAPSNWDYQPAATGSIGLCQLTTKFLFKTCSQPNGATLQEAVPGPSSGGCQIQRLVGVKGLLLFNAEQFLSSSGQFHSIYSIKWVEVNLSCAYTVLVSFLGTYDCGRICTCLWICYLNGWDWKERINFSSIHLRMNSLVAFIIFKNIIEINLKCSNICNLNEWMATLICS